jgi:hypothetical protein
VTGLDSYSLEVTSAPATEPVSVAAAKRHCRVDWDDEDDLFDIWVPAARELAEDYGRRRFVTQTLRLTLPGWVDCYENWPTGLAAVALNGMLPGDYSRALRLPVEPVQSVSSVQYYATDGTLTTLDAGLYQTWLAHSPPLILPAPGQSWPGLESGRVGPVRVTFVAGYGAATAVPRKAVNAVLLTVGYWYRNRGDGKDPGATAALGLPPGAERLLRHLSTGAYL